MQRITMKHVKNIVRFESLHFNGNFTEHLERALTKVVKEHEGRIPVKIRAAKEGSKIPTGNVLATIESTFEDEDIFFLVSYFETKLMRVWAPTTVATQSHAIREVIYDGLKVTAVDPDAEIDFKLHDFGSRGVSSMESAAFSGAGHLLSFKGSDTSVAMYAAEIGYGAKIAGFSIPASEHSTTTSHTREFEKNLVDAMFDHYAIPGGVFATVIDSYNWRKFIYDIAPQYKDRLIQSGATWVFRPDSGDPIKTPLQVVKDLAKVFGYTTNKNGYKVLNNVRVIQGDGIDSVDVEAIVKLLIAEKWCVSNMAFGMGGGLLQRINRDTQKFAMKCCAILADGTWVDVYKDPAVFDTETWEVIDTESFKKSLAGRLVLLENEQTGAYMTTTVEEAPSHEKFGWKDALVDVYNYGDLLYDYTWDEVLDNLNN